ncbi:hypothetical protein [Pseudomonas koreensis]|nr:hypothetical protein [Pseudomonas koreensis]
MGKQLMVKSKHQRCPQTPEKTAQIMAPLYVGLTPSGAYKASSSAIRIR